MQYEISYFISCCHSSQLVFTCRRQAAVLSYCLFARGGVGWERFPHALHYLTKQVSPILKPANLRTRLIESTAYLRFLKVFLQKALFWIALVI
jgi:hypothetical protein